MEPVALSDGYRESSDFWADEHDPQVLDNYSRTTISAVPASGQPQSAVSGKSSEPEDDGGDGEAGLAVGGAFGVAAGQVAELFEPAPVSRTARSWGPQVKIKVC